MDLDELVDLIRASWPEKYERGRVTHLHRNYLKLRDGSTVHLRLLVQTVEPSPNPPAEPTLIVIP
jgi:hypothetical protein